MSKPLNPHVEIEEDVYQYTAPNNGAAPLWCMGSTSLVRVGRELFAAGGETVADAKPLNNWRPNLLRRDQNGWRQVYRDPDRTREPCPIGTAADGRVYLTLNAALTKPDEYDGPAQPRILEFRADRPDAPPRVLLPPWEGDIKFHEHSYRSFAVDRDRGEFILFWNTGYDRSHWTFRDGAGQWAAQGQLLFPWGGDYETPCAIRLCYPNVALRDRAVHFFGLSDIVEPRSEWRRYKKEVTGREWDYEMRRLFYAMTPDVTATPFTPWIEIASREQTCGHTNPCDLHLDAAGQTHLLWREVSVNTIMRPKYFPETPLTHSLQYAVLRAGQIVQRNTLAIGGEGSSAEIPTWGRFHATTDGRLFVIYSVSDLATGDRGSLANKIVEILPGNAAGETVRVELRHPFTPYFFTATPRAGSPPSDVLDLFGESAGQPLTMRYARLRLA